MNECYRQQHVKIHIIVNLYPLNIHSAISYSIMSMTPALWPHLVMTSDLLTSDPILTKTAESPIAHPNEFKISSFNVL